MEIRQIVVRPNQDKYILQYADNVGRTGSIVLEASSNTAAAALIADAEGRLPTEEDHPDKSEIEQEIEELEYRLAQLKQSIGVT